MLKKQYRGNGITQYINEIEVTNRILSQEEMDLIAEIKAKGVEAEKLVESLFLKLNLNYEKSDGKHSGDDFERRGYVRYLRKGKHELRAGFVTLIQAVRNPFKFS